MRKRKKRRNLYHTAAVIWVSTHDPHILTLLEFKHIRVRRSGGEAGVHDDVLVIV